MSASDDKIRRHNFTEAGKAYFKNKFLRLTPAQMLLKKLEDIDTAMWNTQVKPILAAGGYKDKEQLREHIFRCYFQTFDSNKNFSKEELIAALTHLHTNIMMGRVEEDPAGTGTPDMLSGV